MAIGAGCIQARPAKPKVAQASCLWVVVAFLNQKFAHWDGAGGECRCMCRYPADESCGNPTLVSPGAVDLDQAG